jgi:hypothetical protein
MADEVLTGRQGRPFVQWGGASPRNKPFFYGLDSNYFAIKGVSNPVRGKIDPTRIWDPTSIGSYRTVARSIDAAAEPTFEVEFMEKAGQTPRHLMDMQCAQSFYVLHGPCGDLSNFDTSWSGYAEILGDVLITDRDLGDRSSSDKDDVLMTKLKCTARSIYPASPITFAEKSIAGTEYFDVTYANKQSCGDCGPTNDGTKWIYVLVKANAAAKPTILYSTDGGATFTSISIATAVNDEAPNAIRVMGQYLVVLSPTAQSATQGGYYYSPINQATGVPSSTFVKVTAGFTNNQKPNDIYVVGPRLAFVVADLGEILTITDVPSGAVSLGKFGANNLTRIDGRGNAIVAVGAAATVIRSTNQGQNWATTTTNPGAAALTAVAVLSENSIWVGNNAGAVYFTDSGGEVAWSTIAGATPGGATNVFDIHIATPEVMFVAFYSGTGARLSASINGGYSWVNSADIQPRLKALPTGYTRFNRIAGPMTPGDATNANNLLIAGYTGTTATLEVGVSNVF